MKTYKQRCSELEQENRRLENILFDQDEVVRTQSLLLKKEMIVDPALMEFYRDLTDTLFNIYNTTNHASPAWELASIILRRYNLVKQTNLW